MDTNIFVSTSMQAWACKVMGNDCPGPWYSAVISSLVWLDPPPVSWALNGLDDSSVCMNSSMLSFNPKNSLYWWVQMKLKSAPALLIRGQMQARNFSALVPFFFQLWNVSITHCSSHSSAVSRMIFFYFFLPVLLNTKGLTLQRFCIAFPFMWGTSMAFCVRTWRHVCYAWLVWSMHPKKWVRVP